MMRTGDSQGKLWSYWKLAALWSFVTGWFFVTGWLIALIKEIFSGEPEGDCPVYPT